jgi:hypothetical protein
MGVREDLLAAAGALAERASAAALSGRPITYESIRIAHLVEGSRAALEAAGLVDADPAPIIAATERLHERLEALGAAAGLDVAAQFGAAEAIDAVTDVVEHLTREIRTGAAVATGYRGLRDLLEGLERDFSAAETETASRIAARIHTGLEEAEESISNAQRGEG